VTDEDLDVGAPTPAGDDRVVAEVRAAREALFAAAGYDLEELCRQLRARQAAEGRAAVTLPSRAPDAPPRAA
jgi:hypothetical protein